MERKYAAIIQMKDGTRFRFPLDTDIECIKGVLIIKMKTDSYELSLSDINWIL